MTAHAGYAARMYGKYFGNVDTVLNVASGNTDLGADLTRMGHATRVMSVDPIYPLASSPEANPQFVHGFAQKLPFEDNSFDMTMCQFGLQHMPKQAATAAITEMVRVTRTADGPTDGLKGFVMLNPVFKPKQLLKELKIKEFDDAAWLLHSDSEMFRMEEKKDLRPTLLIHKTAGLTAKRAELLAELITRSGAMYSPARSIGEMVARAKSGRTNI